MSEGINPPVWFVLRFIDYGHALITEQALPFCFRSEKEAVDAAKELFEGEGGYYEVEQRQSIYTAGSLQTSHMRAGDFELVPCGREGFKIIHKKDDYCSPNALFKDHDAAKQALWAIDSAFLHGKSHSQGSKK